METELQSRKTVKYYSTTLDKGVPLCASGFAKRKQNIRLGRSKVLTDGGGLNWLRSAEEDQVPEGVYEKRQAGD